MDFFEFLRKLVEDYYSGIEMCSSTEQLERDRLVKAEFETFISERLNDHDETSLQVHRIFFREAGYVVGQLHRENTTHQGLQDLSGFRINPELDPWSRIKIMNGIADIKRLDRDITTEECVDDLCRFLRRFGQLPYLYFSQGYVRAVGQRGVIILELAHEYTDHLWIPLRTLLDLRRRQTAHFYGNISISQFGSLFPSVHNLRRSTH